VIVIGLLGVLFVFVFVLFCLLRFVLVGLFGVLFVFVLFCVVLFVECFVCFASL
jgi:hypothetical protein